ncbi:MAG: hypothetical protein AUI93_00225 [Crenarchaeota archaeon 13_1_40CM_3_52_10]|nr:MAG: hypothetical protein AUI93_00225 [Crenarchaeota archaeon 13_1_40CM_3_52_10]
MKEAYLTMGTLLLFTGCMGAIAATTAMGAGAAITSQALQQLLYAEVISTIIALIGGALVMRNR